MSYTRLLYHIVFRTKNSKNTISEQHDNEVYAYIMGIINNKKSKLYRIGGVPNHIIIDYIKKQKEHHKKVSFEEEYRKFLIENGIDIDERYFLKD